MKNMRHFVALATIALAGSTLAGCATTAEPEPGDANSAEEQLTIGFVNADTLEYHTCLEKGVSEAADDLGVELVLGNSTRDPAKEQTNVEDMLTRQVDVLIIQTVNVDSLDKAVTKANEADTPIFMTSVLASDTDKILGAVVAQFKPSAELLAEWLNEDAAGEPVKVGVIAGAPGAASDLFVNAFRDALDENAEVVFEQPGMFNRAKSQEVAENMLQSNPEVEYVYVPNEEMALGAAAAFGAAGRDDIHILANGGTEVGLEAVADGKFTVMTSNSAYDLGYLAVESTVALLDDPTAVEKVQGIPPMLVDESNVDQAPAYCG